MEFFGFIHTQILANQHEQAHALVWTQGSTVQTCICSLADFANSPVSPFVQLFHYQINYTVRSSCLDSIASLFLQPNWNSGKLDTHSLVLIYCTFLSLLVNTLARCMQRSQTDSGYWLGKHYCSKKASEQSRVKVIATTLTAQFCSPTMLSISFTTWKKAG